MNLFNFKMEIIFTFTSDVLHFHFPFMAIDLKNTGRQKITYMVIVMIAGIVLGSVKFFAWYQTRSNAILADALESLVNVLAPIFALVSVIIASRPRDENHPYGHGKIEFVAAGFEGGLILFAALSMIYRACVSFYGSHEIQSLSFGITIVAGAGLINFLMGYFLVRQGKQLHSLTLEADGRHLLSDAVSGVAIVAGLIIIYFTKEYWIDSLLTIIFSIYILYVGYALIRKAMAGLMDEADFETIDKIISAINQSRRNKWIDVHNLRLLKYGDALHVDAHVTLPWYATLREAHDEMKLMEDEVNTILDKRVEFFVHMDPCIPASCPVCRISDCPVRQHPFHHEVKWTKENLLRNKKHA